MDYLGWYVWLSFIHTKQVTKTCRCQDPGFMPLERKQRKVSYYISKNIQEVTQALETHKWSPCVLALLTSGFFALFRLDGLWEPLWHKEALGELEKGGSGDSVNLLATYRFEWKLFAYPVPFMIYDSSGTQYHLWYMIPSDTTIYHLYEFIWAIKLPIIFSKYQYLRKPVHCIWNSGSMGSEVGQSMFNFHNFIFRAMYTYTWGCPPSQ